MSEFVNIDNIDIASVSEAQLPEVIRSQYEYLSELDQKIQQTIQKAQKATQSATAAANEKVGFFAKRKAIKATQQASVDIAAGTAANAEALKVVFDYQKSISHIMKGLFALGTTSIAMNRATIRNLESILKEGSTSKLSDDTKKELMGVIRDLKAQEDFMQKQAKTETTVKQHEKRFKSLERHQKLLSVVVLSTLLLTVIIATSSDRLVQFSVPININGGETVDTLPPSNVTPTIADTKVEASTIDLAGTEQTVTDLVVSKEIDAAQTNEAAGITTSNNVSATPHEFSNTPIDMNALVGTSRIRGLAYFAIFEKSGTYYFNFAISSGSRVNYLASPVPLIAEGPCAVASYVDDNQGNSGTVRITQDYSGKRYITAEIDNKELPQYDSYDNLNALIFDKAEMYYSEEIRDYPIYKDYLEP